MPQIAATMSPISRTRSIGVFAKALSKPSSSVKTARISSNDNPATANAFAMQETMVRVAFTLLGPDPGQQLTRLAQQLGIPGALGDPFGGDLLIDRLQAGDVRLRR